MRQGALVLLILVSLVAGCGGSGSSGDPRDAVVKAARSFEDASLAKDAARYCGMLTTAAKAEVISRAAALGGVTSCDQGIRRALDRAGPDTFAEIKASRAALSAASVTMRGNTATVRLAGSGTRMQFQKVGDAWYVSGLPK